MKNKCGVILICALASFGSTARSATYQGNGNTGFGGAIGGGSLELSDDGTRVKGIVTRGKGNFNDVLVIYVDSIPGGLTDTAGLNDSADGLRKAISGIDGATNRSTLRFAPGFQPDYAIAVGPGSDSYGGLWRLANGGSNSLEFKTAVNLVPPAGNNAAAYAFSFQFSDIGLNSAQGFKWFGTYISNTGFRSGETVGGTIEGGGGWSQGNQVTTATYEIGGVESKAESAASPAEEKTRCMQNLKRIDEAIRAYRAEKKVLPPWLSELVPRFLEDANVLICPVTLRTGKLQNFGLVDPKLATSYIYEFCNAPVPQSIGGDGQIVMRQWKQKQMGLVGDIVPIVRCHLHNPLLNLSFGGKIFESPAAWEDLVTNQVNAAELSIANLQGKAQ
jgi:hypothetical protein